MNTPERLYKIDEVLKMLSMSRSTFYLEKKAGRIKTVNIRRSVRVKGSHLAEYVDLLALESNEVK